MITSSAVLRAGVARPGGGGAPPHARSPRAGDAFTRGIRRSIARARNLPRRRRAHALSEMEADILQRLAAHHGRAVSREELLACVWGLRDGGVETRAIDMHVTRLRQKLTGTARLRRRMDRHRPGQGVHARIGGSGRHGGAESERKS